MSTAINNAHLYVNDLPTLYLPNTLSYNDGKGERTVRTQSVGGGAVEIIVTDNLETHIGGVKFNLANNVDMVKKFDLWRDNFDQNVVVLVFEQSGISWSKTFKQATVVNNPDVELKTTGVIAVEFQTAIPK